MLIELWNGVGARGCQPGAGDVYTLQYLLQNFALLPGVGAARYSSATAVLGRLQVKQRELPEDERLQVTLSEITHLLS